MNPVTAKLLAPLFLGAAIGTTAPSEANKITDIRHTTLRGAEVTRTTETSNLGQKTTCLEVRSRDGIQESFCSAAAKGHTVSVQGEILDPERTDAKLTEINRERGPTVRCLTVEEETMSPNLPPLKSETYCKPSELRM